MGIGRKDDGIVFMLFLCNQCQGCCLSFVKINGNFIPRLAVEGSCLNSKDWIQMLIWKNKTKQNKKNTGLITGRGYLNWCKWCSVEPNESGKVNNSAQKLQINEGMRLWMAKFLCKGRNVALSPVFAAAVLKLLAWKNNILIVCGG